MIYFSLWKKRTLLFLWGAVMKKKDLLHIAASAAVTVAGATVGMAMMVVSGKKKAKG